MSGQTQFIYAKTKKSEGRNRLADRFRCLTCFGFLMLNVAVFKSVEPHHLGGGDAATGRIKNVSKYYATIEIIIIHINVKQNLFLKIEYKDPHYINSLFCMVYFKGFTSLTRGNSCFNFICILYQKCILPLGLLGIFPSVFTVTVGGSSMFLSSESRVSNIHPCEVHITHLYVININSVKSVYDRPTPVSAFFFYIRNGLVLLLDKADIVVVTCSTYLKFAIVHVNVEELKNKRFNQQSAIKSDL
ncbi:hypothetical protein AGLY_005013 [Aphis glycines]|uniref:Uncharacterized protein n=1 Tax=Aphis glycines TaxID=307491 RepID=A0A6G0TVN7_APHGL|nr:hypothetical protein AGLY_005013 [Aphis glycines]